MEGRRILRDVAGGGSQAARGLSSRTVEQPVISHAQMQEDILLYRALKQVERGFYVDIGAQHPLIHSVTRFFYDRGWRGINIEPSVSWYEQLVRERPRDVNLCLAAAASQGEIEFHEFPDTGLSTTIGWIAEKHRQAGLAYKTRKVESRTMADICRRYVSGDIHFLKIDVEGGERSVLEGWDFQTFRPWIAMLESTEPMTDIPTYAAWEPLLLDAGYRFCLEDARNRFYVAQEHDELRVLLSLPVDNYERPSAEGCQLRELTAELAALKASRTWRLVQLFRRAARPILSVFPILKSIGRPRP